MAHPVGRVAPRAAPALRQRLPARSRADLLSLAHNLAFGLVGATLALLLGWFGSRSVTAAGLVTLATLLAGPLTVLNDHAGRAHVGYNFINLYKPQQLEVSADRDPGSTKRVRRWSLQTGRALVGRSALRELDRHVLEPDERRAVHCPARPDYAADALCQFGSEQNLCSPAGNKVRDCTLKASQRQVPLRQWSHYTRALRGTPTGTRPKEHAPTGP